MRARANGFTLIEVMVAVAIVAVLAALALPSYQQYVANAKRTALQATMMQIAQKMANYKVANNDYGASNSSYANNALLNPAIYGTTNFPTTGTAQYTLTISPAGGVSAATSTTLEIDATPAGNSGKGIVKLNDQNWRCWSRTISCTPSSTSNWDTGTSS